MKMIQIALLLGLAALLTAGCGSKADRCAKCGMLVEDYPRWIAGGVDRTGKAERFCCPRCMFVWLRGSRGEGAREPWITEYYQQQRQPIDQVFFVIGSDVTGPMGKDLVPVKDRPAAERFLSDHHGTRIVQANEITADLLKEIIGKPH